MKHVVCKVAAAALTVQMAAAQPPANIGQWDLAQVSPLSASQGPYGWYAHKPTTTAGCYIMSGGDPNSAVGQNLTAAFQYDPSTQLWSRYPDAPSWQYLASLYSFGGYVFGVSADFSSLAFISSDNYAAAGAGWQVIQMNGAPTTRYHARTSIFGGIMYMFGGSSVPFNISNGQTYNDLWAVDLNDVINSVFVPGRVATGWVQLIANGTAGMPRARAGHVMIPYGHHIWVYGGFEATPNGPFASNHLWRFGPGNNWDAGSLATNNNQVGARSDYRGLPVTRSRTTRAPAPHYVIGCRPPSPVSHTFAYPAPLPLSPAPAVLPRHVEPDPHDRDQLPRLHASLLHPRRRARADRGDRLRVGLPPVRVRGLHGRLHHVSGPR